MSADKITSSETARTDGIIDDLVWCGRQLYHYEQPMMLPLSEESFRCYETARQMIERYRRALTAERERAALAIEELRNISKADWREWDEDCRNPQSFVDWAKSRAMFTLAAIDMPHSTQEDAERYRWLREPQDHFGVLVEEMRGDRYTNTHFFAVREELDALIDAARRK